MRPAVTLHDGSVKGQARKSVRTAERKTLLILLQHDQDHALPCRPELGVQFFRPQ